MIRLRKLLKQNGTCGNSREALNIQSYAMKCFEDVINVISLYNEEDNTNRLYKA